MGKLELDRLAELARSYGDDMPAQDVAVLRMVMPLVNRIRKDGAVFILQQYNKLGHKTYSISITGGPLLGESLMVDATDLTQGLFEIFSKFCALVWER